MDCLVRNNVARFLGTKNFDGEVDRAIRQQKENKATKAAKDIISAFATKVTDTSWSALEEAGLVSVCSLYPPYTDLEKTLKRLRSKDGEYYYSQGYGFTIYRKKTQEDTQSDEAKRAKVRAREELSRRAADIHQALVERADAFVKEYHCKGKHDTEILHQWLLRMAVQLLIGRESIGNVAKMLGWKEPKGYSSWSDIKKPREYVFCEYEKNENRVLLSLLWYGTVRRNEGICFLPYNGHKLSRADAAVDAWMERFMLLEGLGYNISAEEWSFLNGTHPIYSEEVAL